MNITNLKFDKYIKYNFNLSDLQASEFSDFINNLIKENINKEIITYKTKIKALEIITGIQYDEMLHRNLELKANFYKLFWVFIIIFLITLTYLLFRS